MSGWIEHLRAIATPFVQAVGLLAACAVFFAILAFLVKGRSAFADARAASGETRINAIVSVVDQLAVSPAVSLILVASTDMVRTHALALPTAGLWTRIGDWPTLVIAVVLGDFFGYWRHRLQHTRWLWPAHAVHHSDTRLTWFSLERTHPIDRLGTALDILVLAALGFPFWAMAGAAFVRHYYGYFIHADLPWTFGRLGLVLNSPAMHRWHHARDIEGSGSNFATVFSIFDRAFGTYYQPGPCAVPLGVREDMGRGAWGQYVYPLKVWWNAVRPTPIAEIRTDPRTLS